MYFTILAYPDKLFTTMDPNLSTKHSRDSVINSEFKVYYQLHTIQLPTVLQKPSIRLLESFLMKFVSKRQREWDNKLGECLWAYRTMVRTLTKVTPFFLVYRCEAVLPLKIQIPSLRVALTTRMANEKSTDCASRS